MPMTFSSLPQRRDPRQALATPVGPSRAPTASPVAGNGLLGGLDTFRNQNPGALASWGASMMAAGNSRAAEGMQQTAKLQALQGQRKQVAQYLVSTGIAKDMDEGMLLASNQTLLSAMMKDTTARDAFDQRRQLAEQAVMSEDDPDYQRYLLTGQIADQSAFKQSPTSMSPDQREMLADQYGLQGPARQRFILTGQIDSSSARGLSATQERERNKAEDSLPGIDYTLSQLEEADSLLEGGKVSTGFGSDIWSRGTVGTHGWLPGMDIESARATKRYNDILSESAIAAMSKTLTGATTNYEMQQFLSILADPAADVNLKKASLKNLLKLIRDEKNIRAQRIKRYQGVEEGTSFEAPIDGPPAGGDVIDYNDWMKQ